MFQTMLNSLIYFLTTNQILMTFRCHKLIDDFTSKLIPLLFLLNNLSICLRQISSLQCRQRRGPFVASVDYRFRRVDDGLHPQRVVLRGTLRDRGRLHRTSDLVTTASVR
jgi:hypothetical protein